MQQESMARARSAEWLRIFRAHPVRRSDDIRSVIPIRSRHPGLRPRSRPRWVSFQMPMQVGWVFRSEAGHLATLWVRNSGVSVPSMEEGGRRAIEPTPVHHDRRIDERNRASSATLSRVPAPAARPPHVGLWVNPGAPGCVQIAPKAGWRRTLTARKVEVSGDLENAGQATAAPERRPLPNHDPVLVVDSATSRPRTAGPSVLPATSAIAI